MAYGRFNSLDELKQYEEFHKRQKRKVEQIRKSLGVTPEKLEELKRTNLDFALEETREKMLLEEMQRERDRLTEEYINKEVERRLKEQQLSQEQIEKVVKPKIEKIINDTFKNLK